MIANLKEPEPRREAPADLPSERSWDTVLLRESMGTYRNLWESMGTYGNLWEPMGIYGTLA